MKLKNKNKRKSFKKLSTNKCTTSLKKFENLLRQLHDLVRWLSTGFVNQYPTILLTELKALIIKLGLMLKHHGALYTLNYVKECRRVLSQYLSGTKTTSLIIRLTYDGLPAFLGKLISVIRGREGTVILPLLYTFLTSTRMLRLGTKPDISPIINESLLPNGTTGFTNNNEKYLHSFWSELGYRPSRKIPKSVLWKEFHITSKSGPTGHALKFSLHELYILPKDLVEDIIVCGGMKVSTAIKDIYSISEELRPQISYLSEKKCYRKITHFPDKENKVRVIAILDYWSQTVLKPLHDYLNSVLKRIRQDCTFDQAGFWNKINKSKVFYSVDLTAATDRFPIDVIKFVLKGKFPTSYVEAWSRIMVGHPFDFQGTTIRYAVGNPMGAYSSWASFAVAHHFVVYTCIRDSGLRWSDVPYCLLGDDIVIGNKEVAELYIQRVRSLGVEISESKTHISEHFCEFAKRLIYKGQEITPFPLSALQETSKKSYLLTGLLLDTLKKGWVPLNSVPSCVSLYYEIVKKYNSRRRDNTLTTSHFTELVMTMTRDPILAREIFYDSASSYCYLAPTPITRNDTDRIIRMVVIEVARKSIRDLIDDDDDEDEDKKLRKGIPFGATRTYLQQTVSIWIEEDLLSADFNLSSFPIVDITRRLSRMLNGFSKQMQDRINQELPIKELLKTIAIPTNDSVFSQRTYYRTLAAAAYISKQFKDKLDEFLTLPNDLFGPYVLRRK